ncbi:MAG TPA: glycosyltransferase family 2 protein [Ignavibacteriaceae bacterium]
MKISVITPTFNSEKTILKNVESIINQSYKYFEHIIIDNRSSDKTIAIIKNLYKDLPSNLRIISEKDSGISEAFNKGIMCAKGDIITILNSDDYYYSGSIFAIVIDALKESQNLIFHGDVLFMDPKYGSYVRRPYGLNKLNTMPLNHPTMFIKKEVYDSIGLYDLNYRYSMDFEFYCRLYKNYPNLGENLCYFDKNPVVIMSSGGESWANEIKSILEVKSAVKKHNLINFNLWLQLQLRLFRTYLKIIFNKIGLTFIVKLWRKIIHSPN